MLQQETKQSANGSGETKNRDLAQISDGGVGRCGGSRTSASAIRTRCTTTRGRVGSFRRTVVGTLDDATIVDGVEGAAAEITGALHVKSAFNLLEGRKGDTIKEIRNGET
jgi:hypothetical protein